MYTVMEGWKQWQAISCAHHLICLWPILQYRCCKLQLYHVVKVMYIQ